MLTFEEIRTLIVTCATPLGKLPELSDGVYDLQNSLLEELQKLEAEYEAKPKITSITSYRDGTEVIYYSDGTEEVLYPETDVVLEDGRIVSYE